MNEKEARDFLKEHVVIVHVTDKPVSETHDFFDQDDHFPKDCPMCNHENGAIGILGKTLQFCCRACGWWYT